MNRRVVVGVLLYGSLAVLFLVSVAAALLTYVDYAAVALEPQRAFDLSVDDAWIVENQSFWPSITVAADVYGAVETVTVTARWWYASPLMVVVLGVAVMTWWHLRGLATNRPSP